MYLKKTPQSVGVLQKGTSPSQPGLELVMLPEYGKNEPRNPPWLQPNSLWPGDGVGGDIRERERDSGVRFCGIRPTNIRRAAQIIDGIIPDERGQCAPTYRLMVNADSTIYHCPRVLSLLSEFHLETTAPSSPALPEHSRATGKQPRSDLHSRRAVKWLRRLTARFGAF